MKNKLLRGCMLLAVLPFLSVKGEAQTIVRQSIGIYGSAGTIDGTTFSQTVGQPYSTVTYQSTGIRINPGFQQSAYLKHLSDNPDDSESQRASGKDFQDLSIYPNPARGIIYIETVIERGSLQVFNMNGKNILQKEISNYGSGFINSSKWPDGLYMILVFEKVTRTYYSTKVLISK